MNTHTEIGNLIIKAIGGALPSIEANHNLPKTDIPAIIPVIKRELPQSIETVLKDTKEANEAFGLGSSYVSPMAREVFKVTILHEACRIAKIALKIAA